MHLTAQSKCFFQYVVHFLLEIIGFAAVFFLFWPISLFFPTAFPYNPSIRRALDVVRRATSSAEKPSASANARQVSAV